MLAENGGVRSEFTIMRDAPDRFYMVSAGAAERHDHDYLVKSLPETGVGLDKVTTRHGVLVLAGPKSRDLLTKVTDAELSSEAFPWLTGQLINVGAAEARAMRVNFVGELGWELHHPIEMQNYIFDLLMDAGDEFDLKPFGIRAMDSLRIEKSYRMWGTELSIEYAALDSGLHRFEHLNKGEFVGRGGLVRWQERGFDNAFVTMEVHDVSDADARGSEPLYVDGAMVGRATGGGYGWRTGKSLALGMVRPDLAEAGTEIEIEILGRRHRATIIPESPFDPQNERLRA